MDNQTLLLDKIRRTLADAGISLSGERVLVALSGGADSVCLLLALRELGATVCAAHCNFHLRAAESERDATFVRELCQGLGITLYEAQFDTEVEARHRGISLEMAARDLRYGFFEELAREHTLRYVAIGHHKEDNTETFFLNLLRGTGISGLRGMRVLRNIYLRPLLHCTREEIEGYLSQRGQNFVQDSSNSERKYRRNLLRHDILPQLRTINPRFDSTMAQTMDHLAQAEAIVAEFCQTMAQKYCIQKDDDLHIDMIHLMQERHATYVLYDFLSRFGFNESQISDIQNHFGQRAGGVYESADYMATLTSEELIVGIKPRPISPVPLEQGITMLPGWRRIEVEETLDIEISKDLSVATIDAQKVQGQLFVRSLMEGDRFQPFGMEGTKLVSDYLTDRRRSRLEKLRQLVVCDSAGIVWLVGERVSQRVCIDSSTRIIKVLRYSAE